MTRTQRARDNADPDLPGIEHADDADDASADDSASDERRRRRGPEPDRWTQELPLPEPAPGLGADIVNDVTQIYLNEIGQHLLLSRPTRSSRSRARWRPAISRRGRS